jgi:hypothetical protein
MKSAKYSLFLLLIIASSSMAFLSSYLLISENLYFNTFAEQLNYEQIESIINQGKKWEWISYAILPILISIKLTFVASCLSIGLYFSTNRFLFKSALYVALLAEFVFLIPSLLKILWFSIIQTDFSLKDLQFFFPLSALNFFDYTTLQPWLIYPLQLLNVFELLYWLLLAEGLSKLIFSTKDELHYEMSFSQSFGIVAASYGTGLLLWVAVVMFITVSFTP